MSKHLYKILSECVLLLEYDADKTWERHGKKVVDRVMSTWDHDSHLGHIKYGTATAMASIKRGETSYSMEGVHDFIREKVQPHLENSDPTPNKQYVQHIARMYGSGGVNRLEDLHARMKPALEKFHDLSKRKIIPVEHRDIGKYKSLSDLEDVVEKHADNLSGKEEDRQYHELMKSPEHSTTEDHPHFTRITPHTTAAAQHFGKGTRWCTTDGDDSEHGMFNYYNNHGPLHVFIPKNPMYAGEKYQYHYSSNQLMDEKDEDAKDKIRVNHPEIDHHIRAYADMADKSSSASGVRGLTHAEPKVVLSSIENTQDIHHELGQSLINHKNPYIALKASMHDYIDDSNSDVKAITKKAIDHHIDTEWYDGSAAAIHKLFRPDEGHEEHMNLKPEHVEAIEEHPANKDHHMTSIIARHAKLPSYKMDEYAEHESDKVRSSLAMNPNLPDHLRTRLKRDHHSDVSNNAHIYEEKEVE
jgi:hypothetical protein